MGLGIDTNTDGNKSKYQHFTEAERYKIEGYKQIKMSHRKIRATAHETHLTPITLRA